MSDGKWSGGAANRTWARPGSRHYSDGMDDERRAALYESVKDESFWCETCGGHHPLSEHRLCRGCAVTGCPCGCLTRPGYVDPDCVTQQPIGEPRDWSWAGADAADRGMGRVLP